METNRAIEALAALAHEGRLELFRLLMRRAPEAVSAGELAHALGVRATTLSNQLAQLEAAGLLRSHREGRQILYAAETARAGALLGFLAADCCRGRPEVCAPAASALLRWELGRTANWEEDKMRPGETHFNVLFLCVGNSARSIFAEAILNRLAPNRFRAYSAGSSPRGEVHPQTAHLLRTLNYQPETFRSKPWDEFAAPGAPQLDFVFTVCDRAANEQCPVWPGQPMTAHWGVEDPAQATGSEAEIAAAFNEAYRALFNRLSAFSALPIEGLDRLALQRELDAIGQTGAEKAEPASA